jgi:glycosyltransferase involved in cell wall biosynthesis
MVLLNTALRAYWSLVRPRPVPRRRPDVVVLRTNPRDSSLARLLTLLVERYRTQAVVWDRTDDYRCPVDSADLEVVRSTRGGEYYRLSTVVTVMTLQPWFLWRILRARPRLVHAMDLDTGVVGLLAARLLGVPFVYQCLDPYDASLPPAWPRPLARAVHRVENVVIDAADLFVITDEKRLAQHEGARPRAVVELPNVPMLDLEPQPWSGDDLVVAYIGSLIPHRSLALLVDTVGSMADENVRLVLGGFGALEEDLRRRAGRYPNVDFLGPVPYEQTLEVLGHADVLVQLGDPDHPALRWVSPNKVFESMALGRPVVVADGTLAAERALEAGHGLAVRFGDSDDLRRALGRLRDDKDLARTMGAAGRRSFEDRWSPRVVAKTVQTAYDALVTPGAGS